MRVRARARARMHARESHRKRMAPRSTDSCSLTAMDCNSAVVSARSEEEEDEEDEEDEDDEDEEGSIVA